MLKQKIYLFLVILLFVAIGVSSARVILATWSDPPYSPASGNNVEPPINAGADTQSKNGTLTIGSNPLHGNIYGLTVENGIAYFKGGLRLDQLNVDPTGASLTEGRIWINTNFP